VRARNHCCNGKAISITYFECASVALVIRHANHIFSGMWGLYFSTYVISQTSRFYRKNLLNAKCVSIFCEILFETLPVLRRIQSDSVMNVRGVLLNPLKPELNPICYLLALLAHHFLHVSRIGVKSLTLRWLMSYIYDISHLRVKLLTILLRF